MYVSVWLKTEGITGVYRNFTGFVGLEVPCNHVDLR